MGGQASNEVGAQMVRRRWVEMIQTNIDQGNDEQVLYVSARDWNSVAAISDLELIHDRPPQVTSFMDNPVMLVPELPAGVAYLGRRIQS